MSMPKGGLTINAVVLLALGLANPAWSCTQATISLKTASCSVSIPRDPAKGAAENKIRQVAARCGLSSRDVVLITDLVEQGYFWIAPYSPKEIHALRKPSSCGYTGIGIAGNWMGSRFQYYRDTQCPVPAC